MTLRARLVLALLALLAIGLIITGSVTYGIQQSQAEQRVDEQIQRATTAATRAYNAAFGQKFQSPGSVNDMQFPTGTFAQLYDADGALLEDSTRVFQYATDIAPAPDFVTQPASSVPVLTAGQVEAAGTITIDGADNGPARYRVSVQQVGIRLNGVEIPGALVVGVPLTEVDTQLRNLLLTLTFVGVAVLLILGVLVYLIVRNELRPLGQMTETATAIAGGDFKRRVEHVDEKTEVGRLGAAFNTMLGQLVGALDESAASEQRLRQFLADASHELRTPLTSIRGYAELFRLGASDKPEDLALAMSRIEQDAARMGELVRDLLLLANMDEKPALSHEPVDVGQIAADVGAEVADREPDRTITVDIAESATVNGDAVRLRQVVANLVNNAVFHTPAGTAIDVTVSVADGRVRLVVGDRGPGLPVGSEKRVFQRFWRAEESRGRDDGGSGLGLAIVAAVVQAHGGTVSAANRAGGGAQFTVALPVA